VELVSRVRYYSSRCPGNSDCAIIWWGDIYWGGPTPARVWRVPCHPPFRRPRSDPRAHWWGTNPPHRVKTPTFDGGGPCSPPCGWAAPGPDPNPHRVIPFYEKFHGGQQLTKPCKTGGGVKTEDLFPQLLLLLSETTPPCCYLPRNPGLKGSRIQTVLVGAWLRPLLKKTRRGLAVLSSLWINLRRGFPSLREIGSKWMP